MKSSEGRLPPLLPLRYGRMVQSPFTFFRGAAAVMAGDLASTPTTGIFVQLCGDCHLLNFGGFATPERRVIFDLNDFDETLPGPWEWDLKRLVASFVIASRHNKLSKASARDAALACARNYRKRLAEFAEMRALEVWYDSIEIDALVQSIKDKDSRRIAKRRIEKIVTRDVVEDDFPKLVESTGGIHRIKDNPPLIYHPPEAQEKDFDEIVQEAMQQYRDTLPDDRRVLFDRYQLQDIAMKVVGVGSVGTWCGIALYMARGQDPMFLQVKEARVSVLEPYLGRTSYPNHGQRVVVGQRLMQSASDIFLGWTKGRKGRHFFIRQLRDMKIKPQVEIWQSEPMMLFAKFCGWSLARAHAKSGDAARISGYLGKSDTMDEALADFAEAYADQNERDHQLLVEAVRKGRIEVYLER
ncbi:MAG: DUF2252 domain-containing protein [Deltaproteobacteria bacterium]|nr:DUF2252 domain-containing protein [Deltaproteobacteria bacterium]